MTQSNYPYNDSTPSVTIRQPSTTLLPLWRRAFGWASLFGAFAFTVGTIALLLLPNRANPTVGVAPTTPPSTLSATNTTSAISSPSASPQVITLGENTDNATLPTIQPELVNTLLQTPIVPLVNSVQSQVVYEPFTILPERPRGEFRSYTAVAGDTVVGIAERFGLKAETLAWCNDYRMIFSLRPGDVLTIPPTDGACHQILGTQNKTLADLARDYKIDDPYQVIDSPYNSLYGLTPADVLPGGATLFLPGGQGPIVTWNPGYETETDAQGQVRFVTFASGQEGSCGKVEAGGGTIWTNPLPSGKWMRGFFPGHTGIDLAAPTGTPILAANGGPVLFSGVSRYGYGEAIVIGHGAYSTLYGHMSQRNVSCGQSVVAGQVIGFVGSTGQSTGPHLHFEIRYNDQPQDPTLTSGIGW